MTVEQPRRDNNQIPPADLHTGELIRLKRGAYDDIRWRVEAHGFFNHSSCVDEVANLWRAVRCSRRTCFTCDPVFSIRSQGKEIKRAEQCHSRGLLPGEDYGRDLIAQLLLGEGCACLSIPSGHEEIQQVVGLLPI